MKLTEKQAYLSTLKLWIWLYKNPAKFKKDSPYWNEIKYLENSCLLCEYDEQFNADCTSCIGSLYGRPCFNNAYKSYSKSARAYIASKVRRYCRKKGWTEKPEKEIRHKIKKAAIVDPETIKKLGDKLEKQYCEWKRGPNTNYFRPNCSQIKWSQLEDFKYCPYCGKEIKEVK